MSADSLGAVRPRVFSIPPGAPFLDTLADALLAGRLVPGWPDRADPLSLAAGTVLLPTRRAARALARVLAGKAGGAALLLPRIVPLGDIDDAEEAMLLDGGPAMGDASLSLPEAGGTLRRMVLARFVLDWAKSVDRSLLRLEEDEQLLVSATPADALALAGELGMLIDTLSIYGKTVDDISRLVPDEHSRYWEISKRFLQIAAQEWPRFCEAAGVVDPALRRHRMLEAEAQRLLRDRPDTPVIAAGSTGSMPATAALIAAIARLPRGAVVLPGLDQHLDEPSFATILPRPGSRFPGHPGHPQIVLAHLIEDIGILRRDVETLGEPAPALAARERFLTEALRPADTTDLWRDRPDRLDDGDLAAAWAGIDVIEAADDREEATAIAVALREAVEDPAATAMLVTPDRSLAERVCAELKRWNVHVDDSAGQALDRSPAGALARLAAEAAASGFEAHALLALLTHPLCRLGLDGDTVRRGRTALDIGVLRGPPLPPGLDALADAVGQAPPRCAGRRAAGPQRRLRERDWAALDAVVAGLRTAFAPLGEAMRGGLVDITALVQALEDVLAALGRGPEEGDDLFATPSGQALAALFDEARLGVPVEIAGRLADVPAFFHRLMTGRVVPHAGPGHPRVRILGLLEARLLSADLAVVAGLDEKTWPPESRGDAFLNRPMRLDLGLPAPERRLGQTAHDFVQSLGAPRVVLTRALKRGGDPSVASRFLQRMQAVAGPGAWQAALERGTRYVRLARLLDSAEPALPAARPAPRPPSDLMPMSLSITEIETLVRDPYAIYARHVLGLDPLDPVAGSPDAALRGTVVHEVLGRFAKEARDGMPDDPLARLLAIGREVFDEVPELRGRPDVAAFWWPRFQRVAGYVAEWEPRRRAGGVSVEAEIDGQLEIPLVGRNVPFRLRGRADRIEVTPEGGLRIIDFKTGQTPTVKVVRVGFSPQLTLEGAMARAGAFAAIPAGGHVEELLYVQLSGGRVVAAERRIAGDLVPDPDGLATEHLERLAVLLQELADGERAFVSRPYAQFARRYAPYDHLARVREWSLAGDPDEGGEP